MTGEELKKVLTQHGLMLKDVAALLGMSQQNFSSALKVADIKTGLLEELCRVLDKKIDFFYHGTNYQPENTFTENEQIMFLRGQIAALERTIDRLTRNQPGTLVEEKKVV